MKEFPGKLRGRSWSQMKKAKTETVYAGPVPFSKGDGSLLDYADPWQESKELVDWRQNTPFTAELTFAGFSRGRSAAHAVYKDGKGATFTIFLAELHELVNKRGNIQKLNGSWVVVKRGQNYGLKPFGEQP